MEFLPENNLHWELIEAALQNTLSHEQKLLFEEWLFANQTNHEEFKQLQTVWETGLDQYTYYKAANVTLGWDDLQKKITKEARTNEEALVVKPVFKRQSMMRWASIAAFLIVSIGGILYWYITGENKPTVYETAANEEKNIVLPDGTTVLLKAQTQIQYNKNYNVNNRSVLLNKGEAFFNVQHLRLPFIVNIKKFSIRDIGTSFTVKNAKDSVQLTVVSGKVAFTSIRTSETKEVSVGMTLSSNILNGNFGKTTLVNEPQNLMRFNNTTLPEVIGALEKTFNKKIELQNDDIANKRITAQLDGLPFTTALKIICKSLNLQYVEKKDVYILKQKE